jgi:hypothetical protein
MDVADQYKWQGKVMHFSQESTIAIKVENNSGGTGSGRRNLKAPKRDIKIRKRKQTLSA